MRVLILTGRFGMGHIKCAGALEEMLSGYAEVDTVDLIEYLFPSAARIIYGGFQVMVSGLKGMYNLLNKAAGRYGGVPLKKALVKGIDRLVDTYRPDLVISNLPLCSQYFSAYKGIRKCEIPMYTYMTDITFHNEWIAENTDMYFTGDISTRDAVISAGVPADKVKITGIPVSGQFQADEKRDGRIPHILVMGGGLGLIPEKILTVLDGISGAEVTVIAGKNRKLHDTIRDKYKNIKVYGYTDRIPQLMKEADLLITKPGGITMFEAVKSRTPLLIVRPELEQEIGNAGFVERTGIGTVLYSLDEFSEETMMSYINDRQKTDIMKDNMAKLSETYDDINPLSYFRKESL